MESIESSNGVISWILDCSEYLENKDRKHISDINTIYKRGLDIKVDRELPVMKRLSEFHEKTQRFLMKFEEFQQAVEKIDENSLMETEEPFFKIFEQTKN